MKEVNHFLVVHSHYFFITYQNKGVVNKTTLLEALRAELTHRIWSITVEAPFNVFTASVHLLISHALNKPSKFYFIALSRKGKKNSYYFFPFLLFLSFAYYAKWWSSAVGNLIITVSHLAKVFWNSNLFGNVCKDVKLRRKQKKIKQFLCFLILLFVLYKIKLFF